MSEQQKPELLSQSIAELEAWMTENGEAKYRAKQIFEQLHLFLHSFFNISFY